jgi:hypothetical protein
LKRLLIALAVLAFTASAVQAQSIKTTLVGPIHWKHNIGSGVDTDSAFTYAPWSSDATAVDTTAWFDLGKYPVAYIGAAVDTVVYMPLKFCFTGIRTYTDADSNTALAGVDSTTIIVQACNNPAGGAVTTVIGRATGGADCIEALSFSGRQLGFRFWRVIYWSTYTVTPVVRKVSCFAQIQTHE